MLDLTIQFLAVIPECLSKLDPKLKGDGMKQADSKNSDSQTIIGTKDIDYSKYNSGILRITIHKSDSISAKFNNLYVQLILDRNEKNMMHKTTVRKGTKNPRWDEPCDVFVRELDREILEFRVRNSSALGDDTIVGSVHLNVADVVANIGNETEGWYDMHLSAGRLNISFALFPTQYKVDEKESARSIYSGLLFRLWVTSCQHCRGQTPVGCRQVR